MRDEPKPGEDWTEAIERTNAAIADPDVDVIFQAHLVKDDWRGKRIPRAHRAGQQLGTGRHQAGTQVKPAYVLQLCFYADALADVQGKMPERLHVELGNGERESLATNDFMHYSGPREAGSVESRNGDHAAEYPWPTQHCSICDLADECEQRRRDDDHLTVVAGIARGQIEKLAQNGIETLTALATASDAGRPGDIESGDLRKAPHPGRASGRAEAAWRLLEPGPGRNGAAARP